MKRTLQDYRRHLSAFGPEGVLDAAKRDLSEDEYQALQRDVYAYNKAARAPRRRSRA